MKKDKILAVRVPEAVHTKLSQLAKRKGITLTDLVRDSLSGLTWEVELQRNIEYHRKAINELKELEKMMRSTQAERSRVVTGKTVKARKKEQLTML